ncbi:HET-domain-containing protein [Polyplosphaeria fusca]|uniref:HET-domain-containing protein n=1 Tax=Polyplosphaeria fusca TaxID=682080 RepID=A0A9P4R7B0_9PLEO|nr:HET-domain-containing protein [Polyplosphaeria fusca]
MSSTTRDAINSPAISTLSQRRSRQPPKLTFGRAPRSVSSTVDDVHGPSSQCGICSGSLSQNPSLCSDCQIWNDAYHVFRCLRDTSDWDDFQEPNLAELLERDGCILCRYVASSIVTRFQLPDGENREQLLAVSVRNFGPYCLGMEALDAVDPTHLDKLGRQRISNEDMRLDSALDPKYRAPSEEERTLRTVIYLVITAPLGSKPGQFDSQIDIATENSRGFSTTRSLSGDGPALLQPSIGLQLDLSYGKSSKCLLTAQSWERPYIDLQMVTRWLETCRLDHGAKCERKDDSGAVPQGFRAIDTHHLRVVELPNSPTLDYAALSYTWGPSGADELQLERSNLRALSSDRSLERFGGIPDLILDAIHLCRSLGRRYLWVDRLCIVQDDGPFKSSQIQAMDKIYSLADFTIVCAVPPSIGLPGVPNRPRRVPWWNHTRRFHNKMRFVGDNFKDTVLGSFWNTRGWTFQERLLSRRAIYITEFQVYFMCIRAERQEDIGEFAARINPWALERFDHYMATVPDFTSRNLSFPSDILNAFTGIGNRFAEAQGAALTWGLPEKYFAQALLWEPRDKAIRREETPNIPSWSWAAWKGPIRYDPNSRVEKLDIGTLVRFFFQDPTKGLRPVNNDEVWFFTRLSVVLTQGSLPDVDALYPEKKYMPPAKESTKAWKDCPHNPWVMAQHNLDEAEAVRASHHPGSLLFTTTLAKVLLKERVLRDRDTDTTFITLDIQDQNMNVVGEIARLHRSWAETNINLSQPHEIIVLAAGIVSMPFRFAQTHSTQHVSGETREPDAKSEPWYLQIMLIQRNAATDLAQRLGIGVVEMRAWKQCTPEWRTIILVSARQRREAPLDFSNIWRWANQFKTLGGGQIPLHRLDAWCGCEVGANWLLKSGIESPVQLHRTVAALSNLAIAWDDSKQRRLLLHTSQIYQL